MDLVFVLLDLFVWERLRLFQHEISSIRFGPILRLVQLVKNKVSLNYWWCWWIMSDRLCQTLVRLDLCPFFRLLENRLVSNYSKNRRMFIEVQQQIVFFISLVSKQTNKQSHRIASHRITSHHIISHHITHHITHHTSHHITSHITSHHITSHHITSHHITSHIII